MILYRIQECFYREPERPAGVRSNYVATVQPTRYFKGDLWQLNLLGFGIGYHAIDIKQPRSRAGRASKFGIDGSICDGLIRDQGDATASVNARTAFSAKDRSWIFCRAISNLGLGLDLRLAENVSQDVHTQPERCGS